MSCMSKTKSLFTALLVTTIIVATIGLANSLYFSWGQVGTNVTGILSSNTTWTKAGSPYSLTGPTAVNVGATLTIEPGVTLNLNSFYIQVNGTLTAKGAAANIIQFTGGLLRFTPVSTGWNDQAGSGCVIEYANLTATSISASTALKLSQDSILGDSVIVGDSSVILNSNISSFLTVGNFSTVSNNQISNSIIVNAGESCRFSYNKIEGGSISAGDKSTVTGNTVGSGVVCAGNQSIISNNIIQGQVYGGVISNNTIFAASNVNVQGTTVSNNNITGGTVTASTAITNNLIKSGNYTTDFRVFGGFATVTEDTSAIIGIGSPNISGNNITGGGTYVYAYIFYSSSTTLPAIDLSSSSQATVSNNVINGKSGLAINGNSYSVTNNTVTGDINGTAFTISNNTVSGSIDIYGGNPTISNNTISKGISVSTQAWAITGNSAKGIAVNQGNGYISSNYVQNGIGIIIFNASATIEKNYISNNGDSTLGVNGTVGGNRIFGVAVTNGAVLIRNNTIVNNSVGIDLTSPLPVTTINYNNLQSNGQNLVLELGTTNNVNATLNWWGTTNTQAINQSIHDFKNDFNLGTVNFISFLTSPNPQASPTLNQSQNPPPSPSPSPPAIPEFPSWVILPVLLTIATILTAAIKRKRQR